MDKQEWYNMGAQIGDLVQSAIDSNDFKQLNQSITETINDTVKMVQKNIQNGARSASREWEDTSFNRRNAYGQDTVRVKGRNAYQQAMERASRKVEEKAREKFSGKSNLPVRAASDYKGITFMAVGYSFMGIFGILGMVFLGLSSAWGGFGVPGAIFLTLTGGFMGMGLRGSRLHSRVKRQKHYLQIMGNRDTCMLEELAAGTGKTKKYVARDLKSMIRAHMFAGEAYLDDQETCLMTSQTAYRQYQMAMKQFEQRKAEARLQEQRKEAKNLSEEEQEISRDGREFIDHIHACNDAIPGQVMSDKLDRLENVVTRIFEQVARKPESAPDLHKMMSYYLPITRKLVDAYRDMDAQPVEGQNISKTKKEIEDSLDTINTAFENLLDSFFQDTAWDISSDISVLHTMMAQDGLMKKDFAAGERIRTVAGDMNAAGNVEVAGDMNAAGNVEVTGNMDRAKK